MRLPSLVIALTFASAPVLAAEVREIPEQGGVRMTGFTDLSGDGAVLLGVCRVGSAQQVPCRWREGSGNPLRRSPAGGAGTPSPRATGTAPAAPSRPDTRPEAPPRRQRGP